MTGPNGEALENVTPEALASFVRGNAGLVTALDAKNISVPTANGTQRIEAVVESLSSPAR